MPRELKYVDAVRLLGGSGPLLKAVDTALGAALTVATAGGSHVALSLFDAKSEVVRLGESTLGRLSQTVRGLSRYDRSERLQAAHAVLVVTAFFEELDDLLAETGLGSPAFTRDDQIMLAGGDGPDWLSALLGAPVPAPNPARGPDSFLRSLRQWFAASAGRVSTHLAGLAIWDDATDQAQQSYLAAARDRLPRQAVERYEAATRKLAGEMPEFAFWTQRAETLALSRGLESLETTLLRVSSQRDPARHRAALATAYRARLRGPILGGDSGPLHSGPRHSGEVRMPSLGDGYLDPRFRARSGGPTARPADESWWSGAVHDNLARFLAVHLTTPAATDAPMLLLGQPGAGKSTLTRVLAARLPAADFLTVRVALREVPAEAEIQDQIEQAVRSAIGETVSWAALVADADGALPVVLLDGFDELLQATGVHQSDYLERVAAFQQREASLGRPVAVIVTSRSAVADRARVPVDSKVVRLEPFDDHQVGQWLSLWNAASGHSLDPAAVLRFPALAGQPLLLMMLALFDATGQDLHSVSDTGNLYERLLSEFAEREVRRVHPGQPDGDVPRLVEDELLRLSVVAFAMFHRQRLWVTSPELDADLRALGLVSPRSPASFRGEISPGQEMIGRFFFIQRARALQEGAELQTYEFLHATFGEYLVARLTVRALHDAMARDAASTLPLGGTLSDDLLPRLLGFTPLTARTNALPFVRGMLDGGERLWLVQRLSEAVISPRLIEGPYQPVAKRPDFWMATYSFNLALLVLACGRSLRASELFRLAADPAKWMRITALQWQAAIPSGIWLDSLRDIRVTRSYAEDGRRDIVLDPTPQDASHEAPTVALSWSLQDASDHERTWWGVVGASPAFRSLQLSAGVTDDLLRHALQPLLESLPYTVGAVRNDASGVLTSVAHELIHLIVTTATPSDRAALLDAYERVVGVVKSRSYPAADPGDSVNALILRLLAADRELLGPDADRLRARLVDESGTPANPSS